MTALDQPALPADGAPRGSSPASVRCGPPSPLDLTELERRLGDPTDAANPIGPPAVLVADEQAELLAAGTALLDEYCLNAEFVPTPLGGRLHQVDRLGQIGRAIFRRDTTMGLAYGLTNYIAAATVWTDGTTEQQRWLAELLLDNRRAAAAYTELSHGNDFTRNELTARRSGDRWLVNGRKELVNNAGRADAMLLFARTGDTPGSRSHSHLLLDLTALPAGSVRPLPNFPTVGVRGCHLAGIEFRDCPVPHDAVVGAVGGAMETVLRAFQSTRGSLPSMAVGVLDSQLRLATAFSLRRRLFDRQLVELPATQAVLTTAFTDLLICDALSSVVARSLHLLPDQTSVSTAAAKYLVPKVLAEADRRLAVLLGAQSYLRRGPFAMFVKNSRDLQLLTFGHANATVCQATMIPQLARLAERSWLRADPAPAELFDLATVLPALDYRRLELTARGQDSVTAEFSALTAETAPEEPLGRLARTLRSELGQLGEQCRELPGRHRTVVAGRAGFLLADRYAILLAAASCIGIWRQARGGPDAFLREPAWLQAALARLGGRLGLATGGVDHQPLFTELLRRHGEQRTFDLASLQLGTGHREPLTLPIATGGDRDDQAGADT
ncbi:acyl-CoA dehydrogenase [Frankia sp. Ag45/Mut15]|uniref:Acyl-CoA dehydrogenase n=1 Tax=Frankia umida TaxID=573489 RepID=A0ABT0K245_9ACTN|nr:acyl-CoA dehydrogenase [Frankia umida]MCK9877843.1 acyl-CoA dehydrogenase [Frankia umida]